MYSSHVYSIRGSTLDGMHVVVLLGIYELLLFLHIFVDGLSRRLRPISFFFPSGGSRLLHLHITSI